MFSIFAYSQAKKEAKNALARHGLAKSARSDQLGLKPLDPSKLDVSSSVLFRLQIVL